MEKEVMESEYQSSTI